MGDWKPIETAPKDGQPILLWDGLPFVVRWDGKFWRTPHGVKVEWAYLWSRIGSPIEETEDVTVSYFAPLRGLISFSAFGYQFSLKSSVHREYWSERNRRGCRVVYLPFGWRLTIRSVQQREVQGCA